MVLMKKLIVCLMILSFVLSACTSYSDVEKLLEEKENGITSEVADDETIVPEPEPEVSVPPPGKVRVAPLVENTMLPFWSVLYTVTPADESRPSASDVG